MAWSSIRDNLSDKRARLNKIENLLYQNREGMTIAELAHRVEIGERTVRRDLAALQNEGVPISDEKGRWFLVEGQYMPSIRVTLPEAATLFLASRLMLNYSNRYDRNIESAFSKLTPLVPSPLCDQIRQTIEWMRGLHRDENYARIMETLCRALISGRVVKIRYWTYGAEEAGERVIEPYSIQPSVLERANYVIGFCHKAQTIRTFKVERIREIELLEDRYTIPGDFDINSHMGSSWGIVEAERAETVRLKFTKELARMATEAIWHPSQVIERQSDGSVILILKVGGTPDFTGWVLHWGENVEVLEPVSLRREVAGKVRAISRIYRKKRRFLAQRRQWPKWQPRGHSRAYSYKELH